MARKRSIEERFIEIDPDGSTWAVRFLGFERRKINNFDQRLQSHFGSAAITFQISETDFVSHFPDENAFTYARVIDELPIYTNWELQDTNKVIPVFRSNDSALNARMNVKFKNLLNMKQVFVFSDYSETSCFYLWLNTRTREIIVPALPNIFNNGKLCMGDGWEDENLPELPQEAFEESLKVFQTSPWQTDLLNDRNQTEVIPTLFDYDSDLNQNTDIKNWSVDMTQTSHVAFNDICKKILDNS